MVILDEAQLLPPEFLEPCLSAIRALSKYYGVTFVLCTATQPTFHPREINGHPFAGLPDVRELMRGGAHVQDPNDLYQDLDRVKLHWPNTSVPTTWDELAERITRHDQTLTIVNRKAHARELAKRLPDTLYLSTDLCGAHRAERIEEIRFRLEANRERTKSRMPVCLFHVVSTQLIEAGVDVDFPVVFRPINGETAETCLAVGHHLAKALVGSDPLDVEGAHALMDRLIFANNSIKSAFDIALHDIAGQHAGLPLSAYLGGVENSALVTDYTVSIGAPEKMAADAMDIVRNGFTVIKVKLGGNGDQDIERITSIRDAIGPKIPLRIDANQGWDPDTAIRVLNALADLNIQHCEEPIPRWQFMEMRKVKEASPIPIMADESCCDHHDAERLIAMGACQRFNVKLGKSGGLFKARKIIALAEAAGMEVQLGGFLESRLAFTASAHLALTSTAVKYCDMDTPLMFTADPVEGGLRYGPKGELTVPTGPGLGARIAPAWLASPVHVITA